MDLKTKIDLGGCNVVSYLDERFVLAVSSSVTLSLPEQYSAVQTAPELRDYVKRGKLWVTRASSCQLDLSLRFDTCDGSREGMKANLLDIFEACPVRQPHTSQNIVQRLISIDMASTWASAPPRHQN